MSQALASRKGYPTMKKHDAYDLVAIDGTSLSSGDGSVVEETIPLTAVIQQHRETFHFDIVRMASHEIVLGMPWLKAHNPSIDWKKRLLTFERCNCVVAIQPTARQRSEVDKKLNAKCELAASKKDDQHNESDSLGTSKGQQGHDGRVREGSHTPSENLESPRKEDPLGNIPGVYKEWKPLFREEVTAKALPEHQS